MNIINLILGEVNWSNISADWPDFILSGYQNVFANWTYPLIFLGLIGYIYCINRSAISAAAAICIIFGVFGVTGIFAYEDVAEFSMLSWVIVVAAFAGLFTALFTSKRRH